MRACRPASAPTLRVSGAASHLSASGCACRACRSALATPRRAWLAQPPPPLAPLVMCRSRRRARLPQRQRLRRRGGSRDAGGAGCQARQAARRERPARWACSLLSPRALPGASCRAQRCCQRGLRLWPAAAKPCCCPRHLPPVPQRCRMTRRWRGSWTRRSMRGGARERSSRRSWMGRRRGRMRRTRRCPRWALRLQAMCVRGRLAPLPRLPPVAWPCLTSLRPRLACRRTTTTCRTDAAHAHARLPHTLHSSSPGTAALLHSCLAVCFPRHPCTHPLCLRPLL